MSINKKFVLIKFETDQSLRIVQYTDGKLNKILKYIEMIYGNNFTHRDLNVSDSIYEFKNLLDEYGFLRNNVSCVDERKLAQHLKNLTKNYDEIMGSKGTDYEKDEDITEVNNKSTPIDFFLNNDKMFPEPAQGNIFDCPAPSFFEMDGNPISCCSSVVDAEGETLDDEKKDTVRVNNNGEISINEPEAFDGTIFTPVNVDFEINTPVDYKFDDDLEEVLEKKIEERYHNDTDTQSSEDTYSVDFDTDSEDTIESVVEDDVKLEHIDNPFEKELEMFSSPEPKNPPLPLNLENIDYNAGWTEPPIPEGNILDSPVHTINPENDIYSRSFFTPTTSLRNANHQLRSDPTIPKMFVSPWVQSTIDPDISSKGIFDNNPSQESTLNVTGFNDDNYSVYCMVDQKFYCICLNKRIFKVYVLTKDIYHDLKEYFPEIELVKDVNIMNDRIDIVKKSFSDNYFTTKEEVEKELEKVLNPQPEKNQTPSKQQMLNYIKSKFNIDGVTDKNTEANDLIVRNIINDMYVKYSYRKVVEVAVPQILTELGLKRHGSNEWSGISAKVCYSYRYFFDSKNTWFETDKGEN